MRKKGTKQKIDSRVYFLITSFYSLKADNRWYKTIHIFENLNNTNNKAKILDI